MENKLVASDPFYRIIAGGEQKDFPVSQLKEAMNFFEKALKYWDYASMRLMYVFRRIKDGEVARDNQEE